MAGEPRRQPLRGLDHARQLDDPALRQRYVTAVFDLVAPRYDAFTRWFSFGMDGGWKREAAALASEAIAAHRRTVVVADLATGTGDIAFALAGERRVVAGFDVSHEMLVRAAERAGASGGQPPRFAAGDMTALPLPDASVDLVTIGYGLRNASRLDAAISEVTRVLRPGGHVVTLDFFRPTNAAWRRLFLAYLAAAGSLYGWAWHREPAAYAYISRSLERFVTAEALSELLEASGFAVRHVRRKLLGGVCVHSATKR